MPDDIAQTGNTSLPFARKMLDARCAAQHFGAWAIESKWFQAALMSVRSGALKAQEPSAAYDDEDEDSEELYQIRDGIAVITVDGQMTKRGSSFGGCSTIQVRKALRQAADDWQVRGVMLHICSPGGTVAGTSDLAEDITALRSGKFSKDKKPVYAYIADMGCSAAYWVASQCERIYANTTAIIGSIGTYTVLADDTKWQEEIGIKWQVISTGAYKGLGADGQVSDLLVADVQREVNELNAPFLAAVQAGRGKKISDITAVSDGRAYVADKSQQLGLIDEIASLDAAIQALSSRSVKMNPTEQVKQIAAEHPEAVQSFIEQGKKAGIAEAHKAEIDRMRTIADACPGREKLAIKSFLENEDAEAVKRTVTVLEEEAASRKANDDKLAGELASKDKEIEKLRAQVGTQGAIGTAGSAKEDEQKQQVAGDPSKIEDPKARAEAEWASDENVRKSFSTKERYVAVRTAELKGKLKTAK